MPPSRTHSQAQAPSNNIFRRFANKLRSSTTPARSAPTSAAPQPTRKRTGLLGLPKAPVPAAPPNDFTSREQRQAALRARGLLPNVPSAYRDANGFMVSLSEQEAELDRRYTVVLDEKTADAVGSEATRIREAWLARNRDEDESSSVRGSLDVAGRDGEDAARRAGRDGVMGDRSPVQATFTDAPSPTGVASPLEATVEDFQTAPSSPFDAAAPLVVSTYISTSPTDNLLSAVDENDDAQTPLAASPAGTVRAKPRKEKPPPIIVTAQRPSTSLDATRAPAAEATAPSDARATSLPSRGRPAAASAYRQQAQPPLLGHSTSSGGSSGTGSRTTTLPALSPTRTASSSGAESALPTPTTLSCGRDVSISRSSDASHAHSARGRQDVRKSVPLIQSSIEETDSSEEDLEQFGAARAPAPMVTMGGAGAAPATARPRPARAQTAAEVTEMQTNRKSFSLFGKKSASMDGSRPTAHGSSSMSNLRRAFGGLGAKAQQPPRPRSSLDPSVSAQRVRHFDASHLPPSPTYPAHLPPSTNYPAHVVPLQGRTTGVGLRPRQALAPTMHSRGSILHQAHFIQDEESRRLSEMAFLT
ncbi:hypothetical protein C2E23DRAFT_881963 [Lenzites betulinus]|nr:hypothetical protein C2E23DRAFT_881963 [Lenzites betulinus]